ncbi:hypothetical protein KIN20_014729 [Parelaphostrongylus tenuis]|uniref:Uncharacterized protein n=1 Tax=Parelaphostrongylus tenuis TaxID=148309 RepID=A0AAD5MZJ1_PARTN|nr:hypothetical protein KIN20_014729 [Parelaphostrongylus tenuis]
MTPRRSLRLSLKANAASQRSDSQVWIYTVFNSYLITHITRIAKESLSYANYVSTKVGDRVLSCGDGEQLGHPGRRTTKKPRKVEIVEEEALKIVQVRAHN